MAANEATIMDQYLLFRAKNPVDRNNSLGGAFGGYKLLLDMANNGLGPVSPNDPALLNLSFQQLPKIAVMNNDGVTIRSARSLIGTFGAKGTTAFHTATRSIVEAEIHPISPALNVSNAVNYENENNRRVEQAINGMQRAIETLALAAIDANRAQLNPLSFPFAFDATAKAVLVTNTAGQSLADRYNNLQTSIEAADAYAGAADFVDGQYAAFLFNSGAKTAVTNAGRFGEANFQNLNGMMGGKSAYYSSVLANAGTDIGTFYALGRGTAGLYTWVAPDARANAEAINGKMYTLDLPELGFKVDVTVVDQFGNTSALANGGHRTLQKSIKLAVDIIIIREYSQDPTTKATGTLRFNWVPAV